MPSSLLTRMKREPALHRIHAAAAIKTAKLHFVSGVRNKGPCYHRPGQQYIPFVPRDLRYSPDCLSSALPLGWKSEVLRFSAGNDARSRAVGELNLYH